MWDSTAWQEKAVKEVLPFDPTTKKPCDDITFIVEGKKLHAQKQILKSESAFFAGMFNMEMKGKLLATIYGAINLSVSVFTIYCVPLSCS